MDYSHCSLLVARNAVRDEAIEVAFLTGSHCPACASTFQRTRRHSGDVLNEAKEFHCASLAPAGMED